jgi:hypothetical protein
MSIPPRNDRSALCCASACSTSGTAPNSCPAFSPINSLTTGPPTARPLTTAHPGPTTPLRRARSRPPARPAKRSRPHRPLRHPTGHPRKGTPQLTKQTASRDFTLLQTTPGIGDYLGLTILHEIGDINRFPSVKDFLSYCRLVKGTVASAGKIKGLRGAKLGNPYLRWAFGEAAVIAKRDPLVIGPLAQRLEARLNNKFKANTVLAIKLARAVYFMLKTKTVFDPERLVAALSKN